MFVCYPHSLFHNIHQRLYTFVVVKLYIKLHVIPKVYWKRKQNQSSVAVYSKLYIRQFEVKRGYFWEQNKNYWFRAWRGTFPSTKQPVNNLTLSKLHEQSTFSNVLIFFCWCFHKDLITSIILLSFFLLKLWSVFYLQYKHVTVVHGAATGMVDTTSVQHTQSLLWHEHSYTLDIGCSLLKDPQTPMVPWM